VFVVAMVVTAVLVVVMPVIVMGVSFGRAGCVVVGVYRSGSVAVGLVGVLMLCHRTSSGAWWPVRYLPIICAHVRTRQRCRCP
jgi:hypothetical protein